MGPYKVMILMAGLLVGPPIYSFAIWYMNYGHQLFNDLNVTLIWALGAIAFIFGLFIAISGWKNYGDLADILKHQNEER